MRRTVTLSGQSIRPPDQAPGEDLTRTTVKHALPYGLKLCQNGSVAITNTGGRTIYRTYAQVMGMLAREDLDPHRRRLYEAARDTFPNGEIALAQTYQKE